MSLSAETLEKLAAFPGLERSVTAHYGDAARAAAMDKLHARFVRRGDLAFDIGAAVGQSVASFRRLEARVVALEPRPDCAAAIRIIHGADRDVSLVEQACGPRAGRLILKVDSAAGQNGRAVEGTAHDGESAPENTGQREIEVRMTTLDRLIANHGVPAFCKVDVAGRALAVLEGLSTPIRVISFDFTTVQRDVAYDCMDRLRALAPYRFDVALGESQLLAFESPVPMAEMRSHIASLPRDAHSGDIYAILHP